MRVLAAVAVSSFFIDAAGGGAILLVFVLGVFAIARLPKPSTAIITVANPNVRLIFISPLCVWFMSGASLVCSRMSLSQIIFA
ncbi:MAG: hypothetical protein WKF84_00580 [Pyrinomonadaceae bacterium]